MCTECKDMVENVEVNERKRWVDLSGLPRRGKLIDWKNSVSCFVPFIYNDIVGEVEIIGYEVVNKRPELKIRYENNIMDIKIDAFSDCSIAELLKEKLFRPKYDEANPRRVDLRSVPLHSKGVNWVLVSENKMKIPFVYDDISGEVEVVEYNNKNQKITLKYKGLKPYKLHTSLFSNGQIQGLLKDEVLVPFYDENNPRRIDLRNVPVNSYGINWSLVAKNQMTFKFVYEDIFGEVKIIKYTNKNQKLIIKYNEILDEVSTNDFLKCAFGNILKKITSDFKLEIGSCFKDNKRDIIIVDREYRKVLDKNNYEYNEKWYKYKCNKCGWEEGWQIESALLTQGIGCTCCSNKTVVKGINDLATTHPWMIPYFVDIEDTYTHTYGSGNKVLMKCPDCGKIKKGKISDLSTYKNISCICKDGFSFAHKYMFNMLEQLNIEFKDNFTPEWCNFYNDYKERETTGEYDFVIEPKKLIIETDGGFHRKDNNLSGQKKEESKFLDNEKDRLAKENGYKVIRVEYDDDMEMKNPILKSDVVNYFDLSNIDWNECDKFGLSNLVKQVCDYWNKKDEHETTVSLSKIFNKNSSTIREYLKKGNKLGWCNYNPKEEQSKNKVNKNYDRSKSISKVKKRCEKEIEVFKNEITLGVYPSGSYVSDNSEQLFGIKLIRPSISEVANGKRSHHKGYTFKYVS